MSSVLCRLLSFLSGLPSPSPAGVDNSSVTRQVSPFPDGRGTWTFTTGSRWLLKAQEAVQQLQKFVRVLAEAGVTDRKGYHEWRKREGSEALMEETFGYRRTGTMPSVTALLAPYFHAAAPAHRAEKQPGGAQHAPCVPRGVDAGAAALPRHHLRPRGQPRGQGVRQVLHFGEHPSTTDLPDEPFDATEKMDGHLGIIFAYGDGLVLATRRSFGGPTAVLGNAMLGDIIVKKGLKTWFPMGHSVLVEIIHPKTHVHVDYGRKKGFVLIGAYENATLRDCGAHDELKALAKRIGPPSPNGGRGRASRTSGSS